MEELIVFMFTDPFMFNDDALGTRLLDKNVLPLGKKDIAEISDWLAKSF
jgi:hypothetical protein